MDDSGTRAQPIVAEQPDGVAEAVWRWYDDADLARASYASPVWVHPLSENILCSATMVGPNFMLTAAHCGLVPDIVLRFVTYGEDRHTAMRAEDFACHALYSTWHSSDLALYHCPPDASGVSPGDKYGDVDFEPRAPAVYSVWGSALETPAPLLIDVRFLSKGVITSTTSEGPFTVDPALVRVSPTTGLPDANTSRQRPIGISTNLWNNSGASDSTQLSATSHRLVVGPLSTGYPDGRGRNALSIARYLADGTVDGRDPASLDEANLDALGLQASDSVGRIDKNANQLLDLQEDVERLRGENARDWYSLDFGSARRNALWTLGADPGLRVTFDPEGGTARVVKSLSGASTQPVLTHSRLNLAAGTWRLSVRLDTSFSDHPDAFWFGLRWRDSTTGRWWSESPPRSGWATHAVEVTLPEAREAELMLGTDTRVTARVEGVNVVRSGAVMNLDTADRRLHWRDDIHGGRGRVVPRGVDSATRTDWALRVKSDANTPGGWPISHRQLALLGTRCYRLCFDHKQESSVLGGVMRVHASGEERVRLAFSPGADWRRECTTGFRPRTDDAALQFGVASGEGAYLVDDISIEDLPSFVIEPGVDRPGLDLRDFDLPAADPLLCEEVCASEPGCAAYTYTAPGLRGVLARCQLKSGVSGSRVLRGAHSGYRRPSPAGCPPVGGSSTDAGGPCCMCQPGRAMSVTRCASVPSTHP
ncbi:PAN domain-containing protein [Myxococcus fulvus]|uniref:PAN domain-containing protein n=1 Tax=Myxococcus fulvus TaxID=33 RepID=UPI003B9D56CA